MNCLFSILMNIMLRQPIQAGTISINCNITAEINISAHFQVSIKKTPEDLQIYDPKFCIFYLVCSFHNVSYDILSYFSV